VVHVASWTSSTFSVAKKLSFSCPGNRPATSEAYALLYFNGKYLSDRLP